MPKRVGYLYEKMLDKDLISWVIVEGSKGKRKRHDVRKVLKDVPGYTDRIYKLIKDRSYIPTKPKNVLIHDKSSGKERTIGVVPYYPDGIMHRLVTEVIKPVLMRGMYAHSCASIPGRGNMHAIKYMRKAMKNTRNSKYCAKLDIRHFYPTLKPLNVIKALSRKIKDVKILDLILRIISSGSETGLTIGFYINQWLANFYLEELDHHIMSLPGVRYYVRNMDDMILMGPNKHLLHDAIRKIRLKLHTMELELKDNYQVFLVDSRGVDFVGYRFFHSHTLLRHRNFLKLTRQCRKTIKKKLSNCVISFRNASGLLSRVGQLKHCSGLTIRQRYFDPIGSGMLKRIVSIRSRLILLRQSEKHQGSLAC